MFRVALLALAAFALAACVTAQPQKGPPKQPPSPAELLEKAKAAVENCRKNYSEMPKDAVARAACFNDADSLFANFARFPDLVEGRIAKRTEIAKRLADGSITRAQALQEFAIFNSSLVGEEVRRLKVKTPAADQRRAAAEGAALF